MRDPYDILGVAKNAAVADIKKSYRRLAKANHPDQTKDPKAKERFNEATQAYDLLSDEKKRAAFDRGEIDGEGKPRFQGFPGGGGRSRPGAGGAEHFEFNVGGGGGPGFDPSDLFSELFSGARKRPGAQQRAVRGEDVEAEVSVGLKEAVTGGSIRIALPTGKTLDITIPPGVEEGRQIRLKGQGLPGPGKTGPDFAGDAIITLRIARHPLFRVEARDLYLDLPVTLYDAALGGKIQVPTLTSTVEMNVPAGAAYGKAMRLRGKGLPGPNETAGDLYVTLKIVLPDRSDPKFTELMQRWREDAPYQPRKDIA